MLLESLPYCVLFFSFPQLYFYMLLYLYFSLNFFYQWSLLLLFSISIFLLLLGLGLWCDLCTAADDHVTLKGNELEGKRGRKKEQATADIYF